jgi:ArsR family transcriptional regulator
MNNWRELKSMMKALADVARLTIVYHLARRAEVTVTELTSLLKISQPLVSWHLRRLRRAGLVSTRRVGRQVFCSLNQQRFRRCQHWLDSLIDPRVELEALPTGEALMEVDLVVEE